MHLVTPMDRYPGLWIASGPDNRCESTSTMTIVCTRHLLQDSSAAAWISESQYVLAATHRRLKGDYSGIVTSNLPLTYLPPCSASLRLIRFARFHLFTGPFGDPLW
jgi:hypothetical protein